MKRRFRGSVLILAMLIWVLAVSPAVGRVLAPDQWDLWIDQLQDSEWQTANEAMAGLQAAGPPVIDRLLPLFRHCLASVRYRAVEIVGSFGPAAFEAVPLLKSLQWDEATHVAAAAGRALAAISREFPGADAVRQSMALEYPWLLERSLADTLYFQAVHDSYKLLGFGSHAYAVDYPSDEAAFFLLQRLSEGTFDFIDLSAEIDAERVYYRTRNLYLPDHDGPAILLTSSHFSDDVTPIHYVINHRGVLLRASGEYLRWYSEPVGPVLDLVTVMPADQVERYTIWDAENTLPQLAGAASWEELPYVRKQYWYDSGQSMFEQDEPVPLTFSAAAVLLLEYMHTDVWSSQTQLALRKLLDPAWTAAMNQAEADDLWRSLAAFGSQRFFIQGLAAPDTLQLESIDGKTVHLVFDRPWTVLFAPQHRALGEERNRDPWIEGPRIRAIDWF